MDKLDPNHMGLTFYQQKAKAVLPDKVLLDLSEVLWREHRAVAQP